MLSCCYRLPTVSCQVYGMLTNTTTVDAYRGAGRPEAAHLVERLVSMFAAELGMDPVDMRRKNFIAPGDFPYTTVTGVTYDSGNYADALDRALGLAGYAELRRQQADARKAGRLMGIGICSFVEICGFAPSQVLGGGRRRARRVGVEPGARASPPARSANRSAAVGGSAPVVSTRKVKEKAGRSRAGAGPESRRGADLAVFRPPSGSQLGALSEGLTAG